MEFAIKANNQYESIVFNSDVIQTKGNITLQARIEDNQFTDYKTIQNGVTVLDLPSEVDLKLVSSKPFEYTIPGIEPRYYNKHKIEDYLYEITYGNIDYEYAKEHFIPSYGGCSAIRSGNFFGRNFDWLYNKQVQFVVHTPTSANRFGVLGVSGIIPGVDSTNVDDEDIIIDDIDRFKLVPFYLLDGINEKGLFCTHNIVPLDNEDDPTQEIEALVEEKDRVNILMLVRFILDKFSTAKEAIQYLQNYTTLYFPDEMLLTGYQSHFLIGDASHTYVIEFFDGKMHVSCNFYITNFNITNVQFDKNKHIIYPPIGINKYGMGLERWDIITDKFKTSNTLQGMEDTLEAVKYSHCYGDPFWYSEIVKMNDNNGQPITIFTDPEQCSTSMHLTRRRYNNRSRETPLVWITCHSSIYDIRCRTLHIKNQENENSYIFDLYGRTS